MLIFVSPDETPKCLELLKEIKIIGEITINKKNKLNFINKDINEYINNIKQNSIKNDEFEILSEEPKQNIEINIDEKICNPVIKQEDKLNIYENDNYVDDSESISLWNVFWGQRNSVENHMGVCDIMDIATTYFDDNDIKLVEDWGCGNCRLKKYIERFNIQYIGVDGSDTGYQDKIKDLVKYQTNVDAIYMQHV